MERTIITHKEYEKLSKMIYDLYTDAVNVGESIHTHIDFKEKNNKSIASLDNVIKELMQYVDYTVE